MLPVGELLLTTERDRKESLGRKVFEVYPACADKL